MCIHCAGMNEKCPRMSKRKEISVPVETGRGHHRLLVRSLAKWHGIAMVENGLDIAATKRNQCVEFFFLS